MKNIRCIFISCVFLASIFSSTSLDYSKPYDKALFILKKLSPDKNFESSDENNRSASGEVPMTIKGFVKARKNNPEKLILLIPRNSKRLKEDRQVRRNIRQPEDFILGVPTRPEHLPKALPIHPGHTLLRPARGMLKSAVKYPLRDLQSAVYGNMDNLGITFGKTAQRVLYTDFRKANDDFMSQLQKAIQNSNINRNHPLLVLELDPKEVKSIKDLQQLQIDDQVSEENNNVNEILDDTNESPEEDDNNSLDFRRKKSKSKFRRRNKFYLRASSKSDNDSSSSNSSESISSSSSSSSSSIERNPGNPYTIHKDKYKQNWMWNHKLDGLHMNVNPWAPQLNQLGPTGADLFFGRKWWYFNQDDYKPMGRKR